MVKAIGFFAPANALEYASDKLKNDKDIVLAAVSNCGSALEFVSRMLKKGKEVLAAAER